MDEGGRWGVYEVACDRCGVKIVIVALVAQWERGQTEVQQIAEARGALLCRVCTHIERYLTPN